VFQPPRQYIQRQRLDALEKESKAAGKKILRKSCNLERGGGKSTQNPMGGGKGPTPNLDYGKEHIEHKGFSRDGGGRNEKKKPILKDPNKGCINIWQDKKKLSLGSAVNRPAGKHACINAGAGISHLPEVINRWGGGGKTMVLLCGEKAAARETKA